MTWTVRDWAIGSSPREVYNVAEHERESGAFAVFNERAELIRHCGGACEVVSPDGRVAMSLMVPMGGKR